MDAVRCFIDKNQHTWDVFIPQLAAALRSAVNRNTGFTANRMMLGREVNLPADLMFSSAQDKQQVDPESYVSQLGDTLRKTHEIARDTLKTSQRRMKRNYDLRVLERAYQEGDVVYVLDTASIKGKCRKLRPPWRGPGVIRNKITPYLYRIQMTNKVIVVNHDKMKPCTDRQIPAWITKFIAEGPQAMDATGDKGTYCVCKQPWGGHFMIQCDYCHEWYHGTCIDVTPSEALNIDKYKCRVCQGSTRNH